MFSRISNLARRNLWNCTPFAILVVGLIGVLLFPTMTTTASSEANDSEWAVGPKLLAATWYYVLDTARVVGANDTDWRSNLEVCNFAGVFRNFELQFLEFDRANLNPLTLGFGLGSNLCRRYNDVLMEVFGLASSKGTVRVETEDGGLRAVARTFNNASIGTYGQFSEGLFATDGVAFNQQGSIIELTQSTSNTSGFRTNISLQNVTNGNINVRIDLYLANGTFLGSVNRQLLAYEYDQITQIFRQVTGADVADGYAILTTSSATGAFLAAGSVVDNRTGDGTTVPMKRIQ